MATIKSFKDIDAWQNARKLTEAIYSITKSETFSKDYVLIKQIRRAAISVMSNIAEGFERSGTGEFIQFLSIAKGSIGEVESQLYIAFDQGYITKDQFDKINKLISSTKKLIAGLMVYLRNSDIKGLKYK